MDDVIHEALEFAEHFLRESAAAGASQETYPLPRFSHDPYEVVVTAAQ